MIKRVVTDIMGVTHPTEEIKNLEGHFRDYGPEFLARNHESSFASKIEQLKRMLGVSMPEDIVVRVLEETGRRNLNPLFMEVMGEVNVKAGYDKCFLTSIPYRDVLPAFHMWSGQNVGISTYSNGSSALQRGMFGSYKLDTFVSNFFSTAGIGKAVPAPKDNPNGYFAIADKYGIEPREIMFLSDGVKELIGADLAGIGRTIFVARPDNNLIQGAVWGGEKVTNLADIRF